MFDQKHYVPILTGKLGEYRSLQKLESGVKASTTPLIEVPPSDWDFENDVPVKSIDELVSSVADNIDRHWGSSFAFVDTYPVADEGPTGGGKHPLTYILDEGRQKSLKLIPVTGLSRDPAHQQAVRDASKKDNQGICLRLVSSDLNLGPNLKAELDAILAALDVKSAQVDLIADLGALAPTLEHSFALILPSLLNGIPYLADWRTFSLSGCGFPENLSSISTNSTHAIRRTEWHVWKNLVSGGALSRMPTFSDYAISSPEYVALDFRVVKMTANIRYTHEDEWLICRGSVIKKGQASQYPSLAKIVRALPQYAGRDFSWGDQYIDDCANGDCGPGNATTWRQVGTNHHVTFVVKQIASLPGL